MSEPGRPVDAAMNAERPEKAAIRQLWVEKVVAHNQKLKEADSDERLYLTLCGAEGRDLELLVNEGVIERTETGSLTPESASRIAAIENSGLAVTKLLKKFPGLKVHPQSYENLLHGPNPMRFPTGLNEALCRSRVINLDLNSPLLADSGAAQIKFPLMDFVHKFSTIHAAGNSLDWSLLLTLHGQIPWENQIWQFVTNYMAQNFQAVPEFLAAATALLGDDFVQAITNNNVGALSAADDVHQRLLLALVPKLVSEKVRDQRWNITVDWSFSYGGHGATAPMVTWALDFSIADQGLTPAQIYSANVARILEQAAAIDPHGIRVEFN